MDFFQNILIQGTSFLLFKRDKDPNYDDGDDEDIDPGTQEIFNSWALFILMALLMCSLWTSYFLQYHKITAVHETVLSIFGGMIVGLIIRVSPGHYIQDAVSFKYGYFFNLLLPPIILNSGFELHQNNFFRNIATILTFAVAGTFISAVVQGVVLYIWTLIGLESVDISFVEAISVGATLSATDPVTILAIFNAYKVDPKLYTIIFGESILNDAIAIVMFETAQKFHGQAVYASSFFKGIGMFLITFSLSLVIGVIVGVMIALLLKHSHVRRYPQIEACLVLLAAYSSYFFSNGCHMSGIVSLLFCGITLKRYAYYNMSRRTQIATKYIFQLLAQLSENFIFIYLGLALFTEVSFVYKPLFIVISALGICISRWFAVFPLSKLINMIHHARYRVRQSRGWFGSNNNNNSNNNSIHSPDGSNSLLMDQDEIPQSYQMMLFWAGLRGAVGVALAAGIEGEHGPILRATVLVDVVLTVIIFGGTTARMLEILGIRTGVTDEDGNSDDEFDIVATGNNNPLSTLPYTSSRLSNSNGLDNVTTPGSLNKDNNNNTTTRGRTFSRSTSFSPTLDTPTVTSIGQTIAGGRTLSANSSGPTTNYSFSSQSKKTCGIKNGHRKGSLSVSIDSDIESDLDLPPSVTTASNSGHGTSSLSSIFSSNFHKTYNDNNVKGSVISGRDTSNSNIIDKEIVGKNINQNSQYENDSLHTPLKSSNSLVNLLAGATDDHTRWLSVIDEQIVKPVLLDNNPKIDRSKDKD